MSAQTPLGAWAAAKRRCCPKCGGPEGTIFPLSSLAYLRVGETLFDYFLLGPGARSKPGSIAPRPVA
eukprot:1438200-Prorocentrum_lima.AAC.1